MKKWIVPVLVLSVLVLGGVWLVIVNSELKRLDANINAQWKRVEAVHSERTALIPTLMTAAEDYAEFDEETLDLLLRSHREAQVAPMAGTEVKQLHLDRFQKKQTTLASSVSEVWQVVDRYPYLKTYDAFKEPLEQLEAVAKKIQLEESKFNEQVGLYNIQLEKFPKDIFGSILGYEHRDFFDPK